MRSKDYAYFNIVMDHLVTEVLEKAAWTAFHVVVGVVENDIRRGLVPLMVNLDSEIDFFAYPIYG